MSNNPIMDQGFVVDQDEFDLVTGILVKAAKWAEKDDRTDIKQAIARFVGRLQQHVFSGDGPDAKMLDKFDRRIRSAIVAGDHQALRAQIAALMGATFRMHPDPAGQIARRLLDITDSAVAVSQAMAGTHLLQHLDKMLQEGQELWETKKYPPAPDVMSWVRELVEDGIHNLQHGQEAWPDPDAEEADSVDADADAGPDDGADTGADTGAASDAGGDAPNEEDAPRGNGTS